MGKEEGEKGKRTYPDELSNRRAVHDFIDGGDDWGRARDRHITYYRNIKKNEEGREPWSDEGARTRENLSRKDKETEQRLHLDEEDMLTPKAKEYQNMREERRKEDQGRCWRPQDRSMSWVRSLRRRSRPRRPQRRPPERCRASFSCKK